MTSPSSQTRSATALETSFERCRLATRHHARSFYFCSHFLPRYRRLAAYAIYAFCRHADDLLDEAVPGALEIQEAQLRTILNELYSGTSGEAYAPAFHETVTRYVIPRIHFEELIRGVCSDRGPVRIQTFDELSTYCYRVASVVGLVMCPIFGLTNDSGRKHAVELGMAMQLTNILRDIREDQARDRIYLPLTELNQFGVTEEDLRSGRMSPEFVALMKFQVARAREYYTRSERGIGLLANDGSRFTVWAMRWIYSGILTEIEKLDYNVFRARAHVSTARKCLLAWRAWRCCRP